MQRGWIVPYNKACARNKGLREWRVLVLTSQDQLSAAEARIFTQIKEEGTQAQAYLFSALLGEFKLI